MGGWELACQQRHEAVWPVAMYEVRIGKVVVVGTLSKQSV